MNTNCTRCLNAMHSDDERPGLCPECVVQEEMREAKREQLEHDRYEALADEEYADAREQEIDDDGFANERQ